MEPRRMVCVEGWLRGGMWRDGCEEGCGGVIVRDVEGQL